MVRGPRKNAGPPPISACNTSLRQATACNPLRALNHYFNLVLAESWTIHVNASLFGVKEPTTFLALGQPNGVRPEVN